MSLYGIIFGRSSELSKYDANSLPMQRTQKIFWVSKPIVKTFNLRSLEMITRASSEEATNPRGLVVLNYINMVSIAHLHFVPCDLEIWRMTLNKANLRDLIAATGLVILLKLIQIIDFSARVTLKFDGWPWKTIGHLFYTTSSFVHHFKSISELILKLQSGNTQFGSKLAIFCPVWPWNFMDDLGKQ